MTMLMAEYPVDRRQTAGLFAVTLYLARSSEHPEGNPNEGYRFILPLDANARVDADAWAHLRDSCAVVRFREDEESRRGRLVHRAGGVHGARWIFDYGDGEEVLHMLEAHTVRAGDYLSVQGEDGDMRTFHIMAVARA
ncbi:hypothetical protein [Labrys monachus]|uniref:Uncharacterized protein n=1 Tax=Labrys monachus TaxID=217067 RepID=A0ABU0F8Z5_9HYPH|nr:hypothetical protein [Labrys monachus]MDQ0391078.1 hypothetical protein [Labrys monachus]